LASLDRRSVRRGEIMQAGAEKRHSNRTEKLPISWASRSASGKSMQVGTIKKRTDWPSRTKAWMYLCGGDRHAMLGVEQLSPFQQDAGNAEHPVSDAAQGTAVGMAACAQRFVSTFALWIVLHCDAGPMEYGLAQPGMGGIAHDNDAALAAALGDRRHTGQGPEGLVVPADEWTGRFG
jgi:hypothetical protein